MISGPRRALRAAARIYRRLGRLDKQREAEQQADDLRQSMSSAVRYSVSEMTKARPDLGYEPAKK